MNSRIKLLYIEDDEIDQQAFIRTVKKAALPYDFLIENSLQKAHERLETQSFDIIICDYLLGDGTALELIHAYPTFPIIILTGVGDEAIAVNAMKTGAKDYLVKDSQGDYLKILPKAVTNTLRHIKLEMAEQEQRIFAGLLHETASMLNTTLETDEILKLILENIRRIIPHDAANIMLIKEGNARVVQHNGWPSEKADILSAIEFPIQQIAHLNLMYHTRHSYIIDDVENYAGWFSVPAGYEPASYLAAPICSEEEVIGFLNLDSIARNHFTPDHAHRLQAFVNYAAVALKNAQLYKHSQDLAALEERQRLARDLHDSVTQTLFAASVTSTALLKQWHHDPARIGDGLIELCDLTQGALAEMRTLLLELRPNALLDSNLSDLLRQLSETVKGRTRLKVHFEAQGESTAPANVRIAIFRIAQESLNNVVKHARAKHLHIHLTKDEKRIEITVQDDGRGFDLSQTTPHCFGIRIMHERAIEAGITLTITSNPGTGTVVRAVWSDKDAHER